MKNKKVEKLKIKTFSIVTKIILWSCMLFLVLKGIISIINPSKVNLDELTNKYEELESFIDTENSVVSFAENFIKEYMTYYGDSDEYSKRLKPFINDNLTIENTKLFEAVYVNCISRNNYSDNLILVDCIVSGKASYITKNNDSKDTKITEETYYLRTTVNIIENSFVITDYPVFISSPKSVESDEEKALKGEILEEGNKKNQIQKVIKSFLNAYYEGKNTEIEYFVENFNTNEKVKPFKFSELKDIKISEENNIFYADTSYYVTDSSNKFLQSMQFKLTSSDNKFVIKEYNNTLGGF